MTLPRSRCWEVLDESGLELPQLDPTFPVVFRASSAEPVYGAALSAVLDRVLAEVQPRRICAAAIDCDEGVWWLYLYHRSGCRGVGLSEVLEYAEMMMRDGAEGLTGELDDTR